MADVSRRAHRSGAAPHDAAPQHRKDSAMKCPRCETATLDEREREGIVIDVCTNCRGLWLDRGELEKLIARATRDYEEVAPQREAPPPDYSRPPQHHQPRYDDYRRHPKRKKQWFEAFGDIFD
jgi:Zn-finger nucleic acid-binding protein